MPKTFIHFRAEPEDALALDRLAAAWVDRSPTGRPFNRSEVFRVLLKDAIDRLDEVEANGKRPRKKTQKSSG